MPLLSESDLGKYLVGAISSLVTFALTVTSQISSRLFEQLRRIIQPDHLPMLDGWPLSNSPSGTENLRVQIACAPVRFGKFRILQPMDCSKMISKYSKGIVDGHPSFSTPGVGVRFDASDEGIGGGYIWIWSSGKIDLVIPLETEHINEQDLALNPTYVLAFINIVEAIVSSAEYSKIFPKRWFFLRRKFEWFIAISPSVMLPSGSIKPWSNLVFETKNPPRVKGNISGFCPQEGFARNELRNWTRSQGSEKLYKSFLVDLYSQNGYFDFADQLENSIASFRTRN